ncbi:MAG TPA: DUF1080 domain-containing protein [Pirellula sp.]|nr:DUF1080 domain-containing protein [Pirellula sp.]
MLLHSSFLATFFNRSNAEIKVLTGRQNLLASRIFLGFVVVLASSHICRAQDSTKKAPTKSGDDAKVITGKESKWKPLLEKDSLKGWEITNFGGEGDVQLSDGVLRLERGEPLTGINMITKGFPKENFEMRWKATRVEGSDFLAGVTFPVGDEFCSLICGGWGGGLVGLSSIDGNDASENETTNFIQFKNKQWYSFRVRVDKKHITVWVDDKETLKVEREDKKFSLRGEVFKSKPVGYCVFQSIVDVKEWEYQTVE